ncbi:NADP-dependent oxidoreductase [Mammaliicoccus stepanovicii]|uniref:NADP-dependent oxidoreductase n=1 Tax=Mammaliicoccus stepanovicii TaxID=643214 RepID=A0A239YDF9_9STAP|nr:NADP-dependent oxidoreductase [Mammaliicoccus stepanovicii]PNZ75518.1 NADP-dependent oxidoreductase [Mammaliicoccus stepanovicii]GGI42579.1 NADP-dependent oxidoreductase [Mammaliicoccus stepanovicii]SNV56456.1 NADP-dependent oxidoreductase [Mammaliicoccus stepanovicii]
MKNEQIVLAHRPEGIPQDDAFRYEQIDIQEPGQGELLLESVYISVDPYMRGRMYDVKSYTPPFQVDAPLEGHMVSKVVKSNVSDINEGDYVTGVLPWKKFNTVESQRVTVVPSREVPLYLYLSILGMPGMTAYQGLLQIGKPQSGETVVVSAASGAVGSVVGQIAKLKGARVVGIAGGSEKVNYITDTLEFDAAVDYKKDDFKDQLAHAVPDGVDVYFENVGGEISDEVFKHLNKFARIPVCGAISTYNDTKPDIGPRIQQTLIKNQALMQGFIVAQFEEDFKAASEQLSSWVQAGQIKAEVTIDEGFDQIPNAFRKLFTGDNFGKQVIKVASE